LRKSLLIFLLCFTLGGFSQDPQKDSLLQVVKAGKQDKGTARAWASLAYAISWNEPDSILLCSQNALALGEKVKDDTARFHGFGAMASSYYITNRYKQAIEAGMQAYRLAKKYNNPTWEASISNTLGFIYTGAQKYREAIPYFETSVAFDRKYDLKQNLATALNNLANAHMLLKEIRQSLIYRIEAIALRKELNIQSALGDSYSDLGETYMILNQTDSAVKYFSEAFAIKQKINDIEMMAVSGMNLAGALRLKKKYKEALTYLQVAERCSKELGSYEYLFKVYDEMSLCYRALGKTSEAYDFLRKHNQYKDSVITVESRKQLNELTEQFQSEKKTMEIESLKKQKQKDIELANERDKRKNTVLFLSAFILLAIGIYTFLLFKRFKLTRKQKLIIEKQKHVVEEKQKEILDSIHYARRIQRSLMTNEKYIHARLSQLQQKHKNSS